MLEKNRNSLTWYNNEVVYTYNISRACNKDRENNLIMENQAFRIEYVNSLEGNRTAKISFDEKLTLILILEKSGDFKVEFVGINNQIDLDNLLEAIDFAKDDLENEQ